MKTFCLYILLWQKYPRRPTIYIHLVLLGELNQEIHTKFCMEILMERKYMEDLGMDKKMIWLVGKKCFILS